MKRLRKQQLLEQSIYGAIWTVIFLLPLIGGYFAVNGGLEREESRAVIHDSWLTILPFFRAVSVEQLRIGSVFSFQKKILALYYFCGFSDCYFVPDRSCSFYGTVYGEVQA